MAEKSTHYNLDILKGNDVFNPNTVFDNFENIDNNMYKIDTNAVHSAVHILSGSVNTLTRTNPEYNIFKFVATAPYTANQTFTVDGKQVSAYTTNGQPLDTNCYVIGATVLCALNGTTLTVFVRFSGTAQNALKLNNYPDTYFAVKGNTNKTLKDVDEIATTRGTVAENFRPQEVQYTLTTNINAEIPLTSLPNGYIPPERIIQAVVVGHPYGGFFVVRETNLLLCTAGAEGFKILPNTTLTFKIRYYNN